MMTKSENSDFCFSAQHEAGDRLLKVITSFFGQQHPDFKFTILIPQLFEGCFDLVSSSSMWLQSNRSVKTYLQKAVVAA